MSTRFGPVTASRRKPVNVSVRFVRLGRVPRWVPAAALRIAAVLLASASVLFPLGGCGGQPTESYPTLNGRFATEDDIGPLIAEQASLGDEGFRLIVRRAGERYEAGGQLVMPRPTLETDSADVGPLIVSLQYWRPATETASDGGATQATTLSVEDWHKLRRRLFGTLIPSGTDEGIVIHFGVDDYFLYFDDDGVFSVSVIDAKPGDYRITARYPFVDLLPRGLDVLNQFLNERGIDDPLIENLIARMEVATEAFRQPDGSLLAPMRAHVLVVEG